MNFCPNCGAKNENPEATFCSNCGFKFAEKSTEQSTRSSAPASANKISWDDDSMQEATPAQERPSFTEITKESPARETLEDKPSLQERPNSTEAETSRTREASVSHETPREATRARKSISAYDDDVEANEDVFIVPKGARASRPLASAPRTEKTNSASLFEESSSFPDNFSEEEAASMFAASQEASESFAPFGDAGGDPETDNLVSARVEEIRQQRIKQEQIAAQRAAKGDLFGDDTEPEEDDVQTYQRAERPQQTRAQRPQSARASRPQQNRENVFQEENSSLYSEPTKYMPATSPVFEDNDYEDTYDEYDEKPVAAKKTNKFSGSNLVKILIPVFIIVAIVISFFVFKSMNTPQKTIDAFITAVEAKDITTLKKITRLDNIPTATDANWNALCNGLTQEGGTTALRAQFTDQITNPSNVTNSFPAVRLVTKNTLGIFKSYKVAATGVALTIPQAQNGIVLKLDDVSYTGVFNAENNELKFSNIMPGLYSSCQLVGSNGSATEASSITLFTNNTWDNAPMPDGTATPSVPSETNSESSSSTSSIPSSSEIDSILSAFYSSYLTCINNQSTSSLTNATSAMKTEVETRMQKSGNKSNTFEYVSAACDASTISADSESNPTKITVNATFSYKYTPRDGGTTESGSNSPTVELVNVDGVWMVNSM